MKNARTTVFVTFIALCLGLSLFGCVSRITPTGSGEISENNNAAKPAKPTEDTKTEEIEKNTDVWDIFADFLENAGEISDEERNKTFQGDGYTLIYSGYLWEPKTEKNTSGEDTAFLEYALDKTKLKCSFKETLWGKSLLVKEEKDALYKDWQLFMNALNLNANIYISEETKGFEILKNDIYYATFCMYQRENDILAAKFYIVASEQDDTILIFEAWLGNFTTSGPDIPIMPIIKSIVFESGKTKTADYGSYEQQVKEAGDELVVFGHSFPSLSKIMDDNSISYKYAGQEKTIGRMIVPSLLNYYVEPEKVIVEVIELTYEDVEDVFGAIDAYGALLYEKYDFFVTHPPSDYSNYGEDYRFCELIKRPSGEERTIYVAAVYCRLDSLIKLQFGLIDTWVEDNGIGPMKLERIAEEGLG